MKVGQRVRFKSTSAAQYWKIPQDAQGTVMCSYRLLASNRAAPDRLDVRFTPQLVIWGGAAADFEEIRDIPTDNAIISCTSLFGVVAIRIPPCLCISHSGVTLI